MKLDHATMPLIPLTRLFMQIGVELSNIADALVVVEKAIGISGDGVRQHDTVQIQELQVIDYVDQMLRALTSVSFNLSVIVPQDWLVETDGVTKSVTLEALVKRLQFAMEHRDDSGPVASNDVELFD